MTNWKTIVRSAIGVSHQQQNLPCQDYGAYQIFQEQILCGAIADGAGSAKHSDIGSKIAVETALTFLQNYFTQFERQKSDCEETAITPNTLLSIREIYDDLLKAVLTAINEEAEKLNCVYKDLACTLIVFTANDHCITAMQVGDGFLVVRPIDSELQILFTPDKGEYINETTFVTSVNAFEEMQVTVLENSCSFICASTDGLEKVAINLKDWQPFSPFFKPLEEYMSETVTPEKEDQYIIEFLNSERLNARTNDDKTILLALLTQ